MSIEFVRIDDRLIHGQVATAWISAIRATRVVISSDEVSSDEFQKQIIAFTKPPHLVVDVLSSKQTIELASSGKWENEKVFIICKYPKDAYALVNGNIGISYINVGNVGGGESYKKNDYQRLYKSIMVSSKDMEYFRKIIHKGVNVEIQVVPSEKRISMEKFI